MIMHKYVFTMSPNKCNLTQVRHLEIIFDHFATEVRDYEPQEVICIERSM